MSLPRPWPWLAVALALGVPASLMGWVPLDQPLSAWPRWAAALALQPDQGWQQPPWVYWTAAWLHGSADHYLGNLLALVAVAALGQAGRMPPAAALAWALAWPLTQIGMLAHPELSRYIGLSGVLHAGVGVLGTFHLVARHDGAHSGMGTVLLGGLALKVFMENPWQTPLIASAESAITVAPWAHFSGSLAGCALGLLIALARRPVQPPPASPD